jgi:hypothetical protein
VTVVRSEPTHTPPDDSLSEKQRETIRQLEREEICAGQVAVLGDCGWATVEDAARQVRATVDCSGSVLALEGPGCRAKRLARHSTEQDESASGP